MASSTRRPAWCSPTLIKAGAVQGSPFLRPDDLRSKSLMASIDVLNRRYGRGTVAYGTATGAKGWTLRAEHLSGRYTTRWGDLLAVLTYRVNRTGHGDDDPTIVEPLAEAG